MGNAGGALVAPRHNVLTTANDNLSRALSDLVPEKYEDSDRFLNIVQWNLEWFGAQKSIERDKKRYGTVFNILGSLNADLFIFQEVAGPSADGRFAGVMDSLANDLTQAGRGHYRNAYTLAGGEQRVAMMWDLDWVRAKDDVKELFGRGTHKMPDGKDAFAGRTPMRGYFSVRAQEVMDDGQAIPGSDKFDFQVLGVHLKAMAEGAAQREKSAEVLAEWLTTVAPRTDSDALIMGDWNAPPDDPCWAPFHDLENRDPGRVKFQSINDKSDFSYMWLKNRDDKFVSRIDLAAMTLASESRPPEYTAQAVRWKPIEEALAIAGNLTDKKVRDVMKYLKEEVTDHLPVVTRFFIEV